MIRVLAILFVAACGGTLGTPPGDDSPGDATPPLAPSLDIQPGEYWGLPAQYPEKSPHGGLYQIWGRAVRWSPVTDMPWVGGLWRDLNPQDGVYAWDRIDSRGGEWLYSLNEIGAAGKQAMLWINIGLNSPTGLVTPQWVLDKCAAAGTPVGIVRTGEGGIWGTALWQACPRAELLRFIREMFGRYKNDPRLAYAYITTFNAGEFWMPQDVYANAAALGLNEATMKSYGKALIDAWTDALGKEKIVWTSAGWSAPGANWVCDYAMNVVGANIREGLAESISANLSQPLIGQTYDDNYYFSVRPREELGFSFYGDEFELADKYAGVFDNYPYYRLAVLNMLRKGQNWAIFPDELRTTDNDAAHPDFAALRDYFRQSAGYPRSSAPDAWAMLHMYHDDCYNGTHQYKNYEKHMIQREQPDGTTRLTELKTWAPDQFGFCKVGQFGATKPAVTYFARATDHARGSDYIYFDVADGFARDDETRFQIVVHYRDVGTATWRIEYSGDDRNATEAVTNVNDGEWKSAIFTVPDLHFRGAYSGGMDLRIYNGGSEDVVVRGVRLIRL